VPAPPPADPEALVRAAGRHFESKRYWEAIQVLEPLLPDTEGATRTRVRLLLAQAYLKNPNWRRKAEKIALDLVRDGPQLVAAHLLLAEIYHASGLVARARAAYERVLALEPGHEAATKGLAGLEPPPPEPPPPSRLRGIFRMR
jgi:predicted Zn-dependent protease